MKTIKIFTLILGFALLCACGSGGSSGSGTPSGNTFVSTGGAGTTGNGGSGGEVYIDVYGDVQVNKSGSVDTSFTVPTYTANYGANVLIISANTIVGLDPVSTVAGDVYLKSFNPNLYYRDSTNTEQTATGLEVQAGAT